MDSHLGFNKSGISCQIPDDTDGLISDADHSATIGYHHRPTFCAFMLICPECYAERTDGDSHFADAAYALAPHAEAICSGSSCSASSSSSPSTNSDSSLSSDTCSGSDSSDVSASQ